ncbi:MAG: O-antigen ligase family protein, partial [Candidatus Aminicenantes bacterium]|nr:O-antigen ligase family protein [Candidatus Aminicenantes bacterium]
MIPIILLILVLTIINLKWGILIFIFTFPLINNLPYFFGIYGHIPHAPTALVLFLAFLLGWLVHNTFSHANFNSNFSILKPIILLSLTILISAIITFLRYSNYFPFLSDKIYELCVNVNGVRAGGALMSDIFSSLNYLTGFLFFYILFITIKSKEFIKKILIVLSISTLISLLFSLIQIYYSKSIGNMPFWVKLDRINSTFKDPNSFGVFLSVLFPILLGMVFYFRKQSKIIFLFLIAFALLIFPSIGSRSGLLGLGASVITFFLIIIIAYRTSTKKKVIYTTSFFLIVISTIALFLFLPKQTNLHKRISQNIYLVTNKKSLTRLFMGRSNFWAAAAYMIKNYPLTGVGIGAYIIEMPNYLKIIELPFQHTDSAENYFFQVGAELGLVVLFLFFWLFFEIIKQMRNSLKKFSTNNNEIFILIGIISGIVSIFVNFFVHTYIGSYEIKYTFWLLVGLVFVYSKINGKLNVHNKLNSRFKLIAIILPLIFGAIHLWNSTHSLSINNRTEKFGWEQDFGLYKLEKDNKGFYFNWARKSAGIAEDNIGPCMIVPIMASHPDIRENPVIVKIYSADRYF